MCKLKAVTGHGSPAPRQGVIDQKFGLYFQYKSSFLMLYLSFCISFIIPLQLVLLGKLSNQIQLNVVLIKCLLTLS